MTDWIIALATVAIAASAGVQAWFTRRLTRLDEAVKSLDLMQTQLSRSSELNAAADKTEEAGHPELAKVLRRLSNQTVLPAFEMLAEQEKDVPPEMKKALADLVKMVEQLSEDKEQAN